jgi:hypothetical protein
VLFAPFGNQYMETDGWFQAPPIFFRGTCVLLRGLSQHQIQGGTEETHGFHIRVIFGGIIPVVLFSTGSN